MSPPLLPSGGPGDRRKAVFVVLSCLLPFALWHLALFKRGAAYLLLDAAASGRWALALHVASALVAAALQLRTRHAPPWRAPLLLLAFALAVAFALLGSFPAFSSLSWFAPWVYLLALALGALLGSYAVAQERLVASLAFDRSALLDLLRVDALALVLGMVVLYLLTADRLGPLRMLLLLALGCGLVAHLGLCLGPRLDPRARQARRWAMAGCFGLTAAQGLAEPLTPLREVGLSSDPAILAHNSAVSRLVMTSGRGAFQLYVDGLLRLSTIDAGRRREAAAHPALLGAKQRRRVLVVGGGDGATLREVLRYPDVEQVQVIEPEWGLLELARTQPVLLRENGGAFASPKVKVVRADPSLWLPQAGVFDVILLDLLDPEGPRRSKWYTRHFYQQIEKNLAPGGVGAVVANASPLAQREAFWCVIETLEAAGLQALPYRAQLPTMGSWGYALFAREPLVIPSAAALPPGLSYLDGPTLRSFFDLAPDEARLPVEVNLLHRQALVRYRAAHL